MENLGNKMAFGAIWTVAMRLAVRSIGLVSTLILIRLLEPKDFGIVAIVMAVVATIDTMRQFGFGVALIQNQQAGPDDYNTVWTMEVLLAAASAMTIALIAEPAARFYAEPALVPLFYVIAASIAVHGFENVGIINFRKDLQFHREFRFMVSVKILGFMITMAMAFWLRSYWALVIGIASTKILNVVFSYTMHPYRPRFSLAALGRLFNFSKWMFLSNMGILVRLRGPEFIIGKLAGTAGLGLYTLSYEISNLPTSELVSPINRVLLPGFSKIASDRERASNAFVRVSAVMAVLTMPIAFGIAATADLIGAVVLGEKWLPAVPLIKILAIVGAITAILSPVTSALLSLGKPKAVALLSIANATALIPSILFFMGRSGVYGATIAVLINMLIFLPIYLAVGAKYIHFKLRDTVTIFLRPTVSSIAMYFFVTASFFETSSDALNLAIAALTGAVFYICILLLLWIPARRNKNCGETYLVEKAIEILQKTRLRSFADRVRQMM